jgi:hypothetical protein
MSTAVNLIQRLRLAVSGDSLRGITSEQAEAKIPTLETPALLKLWREALYANDARQQAHAEARAEWDAEFVAGAERAADRGEKYEVDNGPDAWIKSDQAARLGKRLQAINAADGACGYGALIACELRARWTRDGEPAEVLKLREQIETADLAAFDALEALDTARRRYRAVKSAKTEQLCVAAQDAVTAAEKKAAELKRQLRDQWAVDLGGF